MPYTTSEPPPCDALVAAIRALELAMAMAQSRQQVTTNQILACMETVGRHLEVHVRQSEGPDGLLAHLHQDHPRLMHRVAELKNEHARLTWRFHQLLHSLTWTAPPTEPASFARMRDRAADLLIAMQAHHETGTELLFQAYVRDMGVKG